MNLFIYLFFIPLAYMGRLAYKDKIGLRYKLRYEIFFP